MLTKQRAALWLLPVGAFLYSAAAWAFKCTPPAETPYELTLIQSDDEDWAEIRDGIGQREPHLPLGVL